MLADVLCDWVDKLPNVSPKIVANYKSTVRDSWNKRSLQFNQSGVLPHSTSSNEVSFPVKEKLFSGKADSDFSLTDLRVLLYKLRKRGILVYVHHTECDPQ